MRVERGSSPAALVRSENHCLPQLHRSCPDMERRLWLLDQPMDGWFRVLCSRKNPTSGLNMRSSALFYILFMFFMLLTCCKSLSIAQSLAGIAAVADHRHSRLSHERGLTYGWMARLPRGCELESCVTAALQAEKSPASRASSCPSLVKLLSNLLPLAAGWRNRVFGRDPARRI